MWSCLGLIVKYEITDENAKESSEAIEEASGSRRDDQHQMRTQYTSPYQNMNYEH